MASIYDAIEVNGELQYRKDRIFIDAKNVPEDLKKQITDKNMVDENGVEIVQDKPKPTEEVLAEAAEFAAGGTKKKLPRKDQPAKPTDDDESDEDEADDLEEEDDADDDDTADAANDTPDEDEDEDEPEVEKAKKQPAKRATRSRAAKAPEPKFRSKVPQSSPGMGFPRVNGKTVDLFDGKTPHTHTKIVGGIVVPLSKESFEVRTEHEILQKLEQMGFQTFDLEAEQLAAAGTLGQDDDDDGLSDDVA